jgi:hypothetical protein
VNSSPLGDAALKRFQTNGGQDYRAGCEALPENRDTRQIEEISLSKHPR